MYKLMCRDKRLVLI